MLFELEEKVKIDLRRKICFAAVIPIISKPCDSS